MGNKTKISVIGLEGADMAMQVNIAIKRSKYRLSGKLYLPKKNLSLNFQTVSRPADMTSGTVNILDPMELMRQIRLISQNPVIATGVEVHFILHPALMFDRQTDSSVSLPSLNPSPVTCLFFIYFVPCPNFRDLLLM